MGWPECPENVFEDTLELFENVKVDCQCILLLLPATLVL